MFFIFLLFQFSNILDASRYSFDLDQARILKKLQEISAFLRSKASSKEAKQKLMNEVRDTVMNANVPSVLDNL